MGGHAFTANDIYAITNPPNASGQLLRAMRPLPLASLIIPIEIGAPMIRTRGPETP